MTPARLRLPFFYGWVIVAVVFVTMGVAVNARTAFSLLFPPILDEFGWDRGMTAGAFSFGFVVSAIMSPSLGRLMDRRGPLVVNELGVVLIGSGLLLAALVQRPWQLYATLGMLVGGGSVCLGYTGQGLFLPNWFVRRRGLAMSLAFSGVGVGSVILMPWLQGMIARVGWRSACLALGILVLVLLLPLNLLVRRRPEDIGLAPDGDATSHPAMAARATRQRRRSGLGRGGLDDRPRHPHGPLLVDCRRLFLRSVHLVRGTGASDQVPGGDRFQSRSRRVGVGRREPCRHPRSDRAWPPVRSHRAGIRLGSGKSRLSP